MSDVHLETLFPRFDTPISIPYRAPATELESAWFDSPRRSSRPPRPSSPPTLPAPPIDDEIADDWFR